MTFQLWRSMAISEDMLAHFTGVRIWGGERILDGLSVRPHLSLDCCAAPSSAVSLFAAIAANFVIGSRFVFQLSSSALER